MEFVLPLNRFYSKRTKFKVELTPQTDFFQGSSPTSFPLLHLGFSFTLAIIKQLKAKNKHKKNLKPSASLDNERHLLAFRKQQQQQKLVSKVAKVVLYNTPAPVQISLFRDAIISAEKSNWIAWLIANNKVTYTLSQLHTHTNNGWQTNIRFDVRKKTSKKTKEETLICDISNKTADTAKYYYFFIFWRK